MAAQPDTCDYQAANSGRGTFEAEEGNFTRLSAWTGAASQPVVMLTAPESNTHTFAHSLRFFLMNVANVSSGAPL